MDCANSRRGSSVELGELLSAFALHNGSESFVCQNRLQTAANGLDGAAEMGRGIVGSQPWLHGAGLVQRLDDLAGQYLGQVFYGMAVVVRQ